MTTTLKPYDRINWRGFTLNRRTATALEWVEQQTGLQIHLAQGSYHTGVGASGGTHDGGGVVDIRTVFYTPNQRTKIVHALRDAGFAAWFRAPVPGLWGAHIHACLIGDREMAPAAVYQCDAYRAGKTGLRSNGPDLDPYRPHPQTMWNYRKNRPVATKS